MYTRMKIYPKPSAVLYSYTNWWCIDFLHRQYLERIKIIAPVLAFNFIKAFTTSILLHLFRKLGFFLALSMVSEIKVVSSHITDILGLFICRQNNFLKFLTPQKRTSTLCGTNCGFMSSGMRYIFCSRGIWKSSPGSGT